MNTLQEMRDGRAALRQLVSLAKSGCLVDRDFDRLTTKIERAFEASMGVDQVSPDTPPFHVINGGRP